ncbi:pentapeptide repeat-containing protein [Paenibacillus elgii]|uniref:Pentapeptide repeat-containing protein n=1 Tax=Paenibacillus elgii TaxID=189691 RepID=A0A2T6FUF8_9BACL|nr:pentapeptide repeat-containing protein [Paenibacillus elgii]PUA35551.1 pentapeptide repeat-containing protein [Paenibacillus elgii]
MGKEEALLHLREHVLDPALTERISALDADFRQHKRQLAAGFVTSFRELCLKIKAMQERQEKAPIAFIHYSMLRTSIREGANTYLIEAYSDDWYWDTAYCDAAYDAGWAFQGIRPLLSVLDDSRKAYMNILHSADTERLVMQEIGYFDQFVTVLARWAIPEAVKLPEFQQIAKADRLQIRIGEFKDRSEPLYVEDRGQRDVQQIRRRLEQKQEADCSYESFRGLPLSLGHYDELDLRYSDFSGSDLTSCTFNGCVLIGTRWHGCRLRHTDFSYSQLCDADFRDCDLKGANFRMADGQGFADKLHRTPGLLGVNFANADLEGANFLHADLPEANFEGANLNQAVFAERDRERLRPWLSEAQIASIRWVSG